jgi:hypothetical protein
MFVSAQKIIILTFTVIEILATTIECCIVDGREAPTLSCACHGMHTNSYDQHMSFSTYTMSDGSDQYFI